MTAPTQRPLPDQRVPDHLRTYPPTPSAQGPSHADRVKRERVNALREHIERNERERGRR